MAITIPNSFTPGTTILSDAVNDNFDEIAAKALDKTGDTITGNISVNNGITIDGRDLSADLDQAVKTTSSPTFAGVTVSGGTASTALILNGSKVITSVPMTHGQLLIGSTGSNPVAGSITGVGITVTPGAGTITLTSTGLSVLTFQVGTTDNGNSSGENTFFADTIPADTFSTNRFIRFTLIGDYLNNTGSSQTLTTRVKLGATTMLSFAATGLGIAASRRLLKLEGTIAVRGGTGFQDAQGRFSISDSGTTDGAGILVSTGAARVYEAVKVGATENTANPLTFTITTQHSAADVNLSARVHEVHVELI